MSYVERLRGELELSLAHAEKALSMCRNHEGFDEYAEKITFSHLGVFGIYPQVTLAKLNLAALDGALEAKRDAEQ